MENEKWFLIIGIVAMLLGFLTDLAALPKTIGTFWTFLKKVISQVDTKKLLIILTVVGVLLGIFTGSAVFPETIERIIVTYGREALIKNKKIKLQDELNQKLWPQGIGL